ncbi:MAG: cytochrome P450 [Chloroflexota bacterium]
MVAKNPPGPTGVPLFGNLFQIRKGFFSLVNQSLAQYGDIVHLSVGKSQIYIVNHPDYIHEVLVSQANRFHKTHLLQQVAGSFIGKGLIVVDGDFHRRQRKLMQPAFHTKRIEAYAQIMTQHTQKMLDQWQDGETRDLETEMVQLTAGIVAKTLFDADVADVALRVGASMTSLQSYAIKRFASPVRTPNWLPTQQNKAKQAAVKELDEILYGIINEHMNSSEDKGDLLSMLLQAKDEDGNPMPVTQVRDEALTLFLAGHETTSNALTWTWYLLSQHPEVEAKLVEEVVSVLGNRAPTLQDLAHLEYTEMVLKEAMRLYPPVWILSREPTEDVMLGDYLIKKSSTVYVSAYITQRDPRFFEEPEKFKPERFAEGAASIPDYAYFPFGGGPRICIGNSFAQMASKIIVATIVQHYHMSLEPNQKVAPQRLATLRPKFGLKMQLQQRKSTEVFEEATMA